MGIDSIIICKHGNLGYSASLRFTDKTRDCELAHISKQRLYGMIYDAIKSGAKTI